MKKLTKNEQKVLAKIMRPFLPYLSPELAKETVISNEILMKAIRKAAKRLDKSEKQA